MEGHEDRGSVGVVADSDRSPVDVEDVLERLADTERTVRLLWESLTDRGLERHAVNDYGGVDRACIAEVVRNVTGESIAEWALA